jgi:DNA-binding transcriptional ArsR family regulator
MSLPESVTVAFNATGDGQPEAPSRFAFDRFIHEPARLAIVAVLDAAEEVDFKFLLQMTGLTKGNLSHQTEKLAEAGYLEVRKYYKGRVPATGYRLTETGRTAFAHYRAQMMRLLGSLSQAEEQPSSEGHTL